MIAGFLLALLAQTAPVRQAGPYTVVPRPGQEQLADRLLEAALSMPPFPGLPADAIPDMRIELAADEADFATLTGGRAPEWGAGIAWPDEKRIVLPAYVSGRGNLGALPTVLRHEIAHVVLHDRVHPSAVPRWFSEGYATWAAGQLDLEAGWILRVAFVTGRAPPLDSIVLGWPRSAADARVAYLLSASAVGWLHDRGGDRVLGLFIERWRTSGDFEAALRNTYGLTTGQLERYWGRSVRRRYGWLLFFAQASVAWAILSVFVIALVLIRRRRDRKKLAELKRTEPPERPAFWLGEDELEAGDSAETGGGEGPAPAGDPVPDSATHAPRTGTDTHDGADVRVWTLDAGDDVPRSSGHHGS